MEKEQVSWLMIYLFQIFDHILKKFGERLFLELRLMMSCA